MKANDVVPVARLYDSLECASHLLTATFWEVQSCVCAGRSDVSESPLRLLQLPHLKRGVGPIGIHQHARPGRPGAAPALRTTRREENQLCIDPPRSPSPSPHHPLTHSCIH